MPGRQAGGADARNGAYEVLTRVEEGAYTNLALDAYLEGPGRALSREDKALLTGLVQGVVKHRLTLDWLVDQRIQKINRLKTGPRIILRLGLYQLFWLEKIPARAATFETVELASKRFHSGVASLVNGVMRGWLREKEQIKWPDENKDPAVYLSVRYSHPLWMIGRWLDRYGFAQTEAFCRYNNEAPELWLRTNTLKTTPEALAEKLEKEGCRTKPGRYAPEALGMLDGPGIRNLEPFLEGLFTVQDESSMLPAHGLDPKPGQRVLDTCAAPGGKTTHLAQLMGDQGSIAAWDVHPHRVGLIEENQKRLGIKCIEAACRDAAEIRENGSAPAEPDAAGAAATAGSVAVATVATVFTAAGLAAYGGNGGDGLFDRILVDAPCSGLGVLRRRADARWNRKPEDIEGLAGTQERILRNALSLLAPGGRLLYSTCTTEPEENRLLVEKALAGFPGYRKGRLSLPVISEENRTLLPDPDRDWDIQFLPFIHGLEGFYMAVIERER